MATVGYVTVQITSGVANVDRRWQAQTEAAVAMARIRSELEWATAIVAVDSTRVSFKRPDADGDGQVDTITYEWSGTAGDPLTREINEGGKQPVLDACRSLAFTAVSPPIRLVAGRRYPLRLEFYENTGYASCSLRWSAPGISRQVVPSTCLFPAFVNPTLSQAPYNGTGLTGEYYNNIDFTNLRMTRTDSVVHFDWDTSAPAGGMGSDTFSVRWTGQLRPEHTRDYTFHVTADDGIRLWVNDVLVVSNWTDHPASEDSGASTGVLRIDIGIEAGSAAIPVRLNGSVHLLNRPERGG